MSSTAVHRAQVGQGSAVRGDQRTRHGRQANSLAHRREREAAIGVTHGMAKPGIAFDAIMHVVATLYRQGDFVAEGPKDIAGPRSRAPPLLAGTLDDDD